MVKVWWCDVTTVEQAILMALADHARDDGTKVYPSVARTAWKVGASRATVQRVLRKFRSAGALIVVHDGGGRQATEYTLVLDALPKKPPLKKRDPPQAEAPQPEAGIPNADVAVTRQQPHGEAAGASEGGGSSLTAVRPQPSDNPSYIPYVNRPESGARAGRATPDGAPAHVRRSEREPDTEAEQLRKTRIYLEAMPGASDAELSRILSVPPAIIEQARRPHDATH